MSCKHPYLGILVSMLIILCVEVELRSGLWFLKLYSMYGLSIFSNFASICIHFDKFNFAFSVI